MKDYEKLGVFYLGRHHDLARKRTSPELLLYESKHLVTHGLVVGMTGSGKTGLCFDLIEEAAIDGVPALVIDPKGDLGNLMLTFPEMRPEDFAPWINPEEAEKKGISMSALAAEQAALWRKGLAAWDQDGQRIQRLRDAAEFAIYTPGSTAGRPVSILKSFAVPPAEVMEDGELLRDRVGSTVSSLLGLVGVKADPVKSRESILLAHLLQHAWGEGRDLDLATLIQEVQAPPVERIGVMTLETFMPASDRFDLAMQLNNLLAAPNFAAWMEGEPLDPARLLYTAAGKPRVAIFSIAHLGDSERMFFVTLLLNQVLSWMRAQSGTNSLRALLYMDEIYGYFPPVANPPSKQPLLTLLKQGRAFGLGVVLATQNPVDLDYKGLGNIGSWFIGRLQTDRDKARVLEGLEGTAAGRGTPFDRGAVEQVLAGLGSRVFLLHSVHRDAFEIFESRWAMSYLRGPLSRSQIKELTQSSSRPAEKVPAAAPPVAASKAMESRPAAPVTNTGRPVLPPGVPQVFVPLRGIQPPGSTIQYHPRLLGMAELRLFNSKFNLDVRRQICAATEITDRAVPVDWAEAEDLDVSVEALLSEPGSGEFEACSGAACQAKNYAEWGKAFVTWIQANRKVTVLRSPSLKKVSQPDEPEREFRISLQQAAREERDQAAEKLRQKFAPKIAVLEERLRRAQAAKSREAEQASRAKYDTVISLGSTLLGAFLGRKTISSTNIGRAAGSMRSAGRAMGQTGDVARAQETIDAVEKQLQDLENQFQSEVDALATTIDPATEQLETLDLRPARGNIQVRLVVLAWLPFSRNSLGGINPAY